MKTNPDLEVHLIGEQHLDLTLTHRYLNAFNQLKPDVITLETDRERTKRCIEVLKKEISLLGKLEVDRFTVLRDMILGQVGPALDYVDKNKQTKIMYTDKNMDEKVQEISKAVNSLDEKETKEDWEDFWKNPNEFDIPYIHILGKEYLSSCQEQNINPTLAIMKGIKQIAIEMDKKEIYAKNMILDTFYYQKDLSLENTVIEGFDINKRDEKVVSTILDQEGTVVHCAGFYHVFGDYKNLYRILKDEGVKVKRHKLIDFNFPDNPIKNIAYKGFVKVLSNKIRKERDRTISSI